MVSDQPNNVSGGDDSGFSQAEIDALLQNAAATGGADSAAAVGAIQQEDIDALLKAGGMASEDAGAVATSNDSDSQSTEPSLEGYAVGPGPSPSPTSAAPFVQPYEFEPLGSVSSPQVDPKRVSMLGDVNLRVKVQLGQTRMLVEEVLKLGEGSVVELDKLAGDPVDILVNDRLIARGEVLVLNDNFCVRVSEVLSNNPHRVTV